MQVDYPLNFDSRGRTAEATEEKHIRDLIEQLLFTHPGERVNRPAFGSGLLQLLFEPNSEVLATTVQMLAQGALQQWLGDLIHVEALNVERIDERLQVTVQYVIRRSQQRRLAQFLRQV